MAVSIVSSSSVRDRVLGLGAGLAQHHYELVHAAVTLDDSAEWVADGHVTCAHWIADRLDIDVSTAREWLRVGRDLRALAEIDAAWKDRRLSYTKVRVLTRHATAENESELVERAVAVSASQINLMIAAWLAGNETPEETERRHDEAQSLRSRLDPDGMYTFTLRAAPYAAATLIAGVDQGVLRRQKESARLAKASGRWPSYARQRFDAFTDLLVGGGTNLVTEVLVHVRGDGCTLDDGTPISENTVANLIGESFIRALIHDAERWPIEHVRAPTSPHYPPETRRARTPRRSLHWLRYDRTPRIPPRTRMGTHPPHQHRRTQNRLPHLPPPTTRETAVTVTLDGVHTALRDPMTRTGSPGVKPDRIVHTFIDTAIGLRLTSVEADSLVTTAAERLGVQPHTLDHAIWSYQRKPPKWATAAAVGSLGGPAA